MRGYPREADANDIIFVRLSPGAHVALFGGRHEAIGRFKGFEPSPTRAVVIRLKKARLQRQRSAVDAALAVIEAFAAEQALLAQPFQPSFAICKATATMLRQIGGHSFGVGSEARLEQDLATFVSPAPSFRARSACRRRLAHRISWQRPVRIQTWQAEMLRQIDLEPFRRRRRRHRVSEVILPAIFDALALQSEAATTSATLPPSKVAAEPRLPDAKALSVSELEEEELVLLDLLHAPAGSYLHSLADVMVRVETLSHVLAWARYEEGADLGTGTAVKQSDLRVVSLPRLKLTFQVRGT